MGSFRQFGLLLWKNGLIVKRKKILTLIEIVLPSLFALIFFAIRQNITAVYFDDGKTWDPFAVQEIPLQVPDLSNMSYVLPTELPFTLPPTVPTELPDTFIKWQVGYYPSNNITDIIIYAMKQLLNMSMKSKLKQKSVLHCICGDPDTKLIP